MQRQGAAQALDERVSGVMHRHLVTSVCQLLGSEVMVTSIPVGLDLRSDHSLFLAHSSLIFKATVLCTTPPEEWAGQTLALGLPGPTPPKAAALQVPAQPDDCHPKTARSQTSANVSCTWWTVSWKDSELTSSQEYQYHNYLYSNQF